MADNRIKKSKLGIVVLAAVMCLCSPLAFAGTEAMTQSYDNKSYDNKSYDNKSYDNKSYDSKNVDLGKFEPSPFHVSVSVRGGYDDNVLTTRFDPVESGFVNASIALSYDFNSPRTQLVLGAGAGLTYYFEDIPGEDSVDKNIYVSLALTHKASPRLTFTLSAYATYQSQPDFTQALGLNRRSGEFFYTLNKLTVAYLWTPKFSTATSYTLGAVQYNDSSVGVFEDRVENTIGNEFRFLVLPTTSLVAEYRFQIVSYSDADRDSWTHFVLGGVDHSFSPRFNVSVRGGAEFRDYDSDGNTSSPYFEGTLNYALGKRTSLSWTSRYGIEESDVALNRSRKTFRTGGRIKHDFTARISATLAAYYQHDEYDGISTPLVFSPAFSETSFDIALALRYAITRCFALEAGYNHTEVTSDDIFREYSRNRYWFGANFTSSQDAAARILLPGSFC